MHKRDGVSVPLRRDVLRADPRHQSSFSSSSTGGRGLRITTAAQIKPPISAATTNKKTNCPAK
ncbi:hypothetical protein MAUB_16050 [Mycolicibacterium aubagnense]|uniref:Uncharacterized protein n=1 Tax=Mycolicibacterium aubagnense TaxID=319707 RepID=A0ABM7I9W8_9MYCO|nr:hypothetical protein MAUB_16050 [Mycolicibacterium aubagnense]